MKFPLISGATRLPLRHNGDCTLLGVTPSEPPDAADYTIYVEEIFGEDAKIAQHALAADGSLLASIDEDSGDDSELHPLDLPAGTIRTQSGWHTMALNFAGPRHRGLRVPERTLDLVRPLSVPEKMALVNQLQLDVLPPLLLGVAESYVLAETLISAPTLYFVCRRVRLAVALSEEHSDADGQPYDYDTLVFYLAHFYERDQEPEWSDILAQRAAVGLRRPMDCVLVKDRLFIADGGDDDHLSAVHVWQLDLPQDELTEAEKLNKKLYG